MRQVDRSKKDNQAKGKQKGLYICRQSGMKQVDKSIEGQSCMRQEERYIDRRLGMR
jgi:hypothetical protein